MLMARPVGKIYTKVPDYVKTLARTVSNYYFVKHIYIVHEHKNYGRQGPGDKRYIEFYGEPHNVDIAEYLFHFLLLEGERQWKEFQKTDQYVNRFAKRNSENDYYDDDYEYRNGKKRKNRKSVYSKVSFLTGFYNGFDNKLCEKQTKVSNKLKKENPTTSLPVLGEDVLLKERYKAHYNPTTWHSGGRSGYGGGYSDGRAAGENVRIRQGVTRGSSKKINLISA